MEINKYAENVTRGLQEHVDMPLEARIIYIVFGIIFSIVCGLLIWYYFSKKDYWERTRDAYDKHSAGSFKGYWGRMRPAIVLFVAVTFLIVGIAFVAMGVFEISPADDIVDHSMRLFT